MTEPWRGDPSRNYPNGKSKLPPDYRKERTAVVGAEDSPFYDPEITTYYANSSGTQPVRIEERVYESDGTVHMVANTISGSDYAAQWPSYDHYIVEGVKVVTTYSG